MKTWITIRPLVAAAVVFTAAAAALWIAGVMMPMTERDDRADLMAAGTLTVIAALCMVTRRAVTIIRQSAEELRDRDKELLIRGLIEVSQRAAEKRTEPLPRLRVMNRPLAPLPAPLWPRPAVRARWCGGRLP